MDGGELPVVLRCSRKFMHSRKVSSGECRGLGFWAFGFRSLGCRGLGFNVHAYAQSLSFFELFSFGV